MSAVVFHVERGQPAALWGAERAYLAWIARRSAEAILDERLPVIDGRVEHAGREYDALDVALNTLLAGGNDVLRLAAWIHGRCESHGHFEPEDHRWLHDTIREGLARGILRRDTGWPQVAQLALDATGPIVMSYTVEQAFPNATVAGWEPSDQDWATRHDDAWDAWYDLPPAERWRLALAGARRAPWLRISPRPRHDYWFGDPVSAYTIVEARQAAEIERNLAERAHA